MWAETLRGWREEVAEIVLQWSKVVMTQGKLYDCICIQIQNCNWHQLKVTVSSEVSSLWILFKLHPVDIKTRIEKRC